MNIDILKHHVIIEYGDFNAHLGDTEVCETMPPIKIANLYLNMNRNATSLSPRLFLRKGNKNCRH